MHSYERQIHRLLSFTASIAEQGCESGPKGCKAYGVTPVCDPCKAQLLLNDEPIKWVPVTTWGQLENPARPEGYNPPMKMKL